MVDVVSPMISVVGTVIGIDEMRTTTEGKGVRNMTLDVPGRNDKNPVRLAVFGKHTAVFKTAKKGSVVQAAGNLGLDTWKLEVKGRDVPYDQSRIECTVSDLTETSVISVLPEGDETEAFALVQGHAEVVYVGEFSNVGAKNTAKQELLVAFLIPSKEKGEAPKRMPSIPLTILGKDAKADYEKGQVLALEAGVRNASWNPKDAPKETRWKGELLIADASHSISVAAAAEPASA